MARSFMLLALLAAGLGGCECVAHDACPSRAATRCDGMRAQICDAAGSWQTFIDCDELGPGWVCGATDGGHTCVPRDDARDGGAP